MRINASPLHLRLNQPFRIAHGTTDSRTNVLVEVGSGSGEAGLPPYLGVDYSDAAAWLAGLRLPEWTGDHPPPINTWLMGLREGPLPARAALDMALHDHWGRQIGQPLFRLFGLDPAQAPVSFQTVSIPENLDDLRSETLPQSARLKLKVGTGDVFEDFAIIQRVRELTTADLCVDVNGAWSIPDCVRVLPQISQLGVLFVEQPIAATDPEDWHLLRRLLGSKDRPPLIADESAVTPDDLIALAGAADGINVKLAKCGGLSRARQMIVLARTLDLSVVLGCMVESSLAIAAAAHLAPLADHVDLDGALLLADDPFTGMQFVDGKPVPPQSPGVGASRT